MIVAIALLAVYGGLIAYRLCFLQGVKARLHFALFNHTISRAKVNRWSQWAFVLFRLDQWTYRQVLEEIQDYPN